MTPPGNPGSLGDFEVAVRYSEKAAVVAVRGEVDLITVPHLAGVIDAVVDRGPTTVVLDVGGVTFMGAGGLGVIASALRRLEPGGGRLVLRGSSPFLRRLLGITGLDTVSEIEDTVAPPDVLPAALTQELVRATAFPADTDVVDSALRLVVALAQMVVQHADGISISLNRHGRLATVAASDQTVSSMDAEQYEAGEGPCVDAATNGRSFHAVSLSDETRWPDFTPKALGLGINAILSTPLLMEGRPAGAINMYSRTTRAFAGHDQQLASAFATEASLILTHASAGPAEEDLTARLTDSLRIRQVIAQAQGIVMCREGAGAEEAYAALRHMAVSQGRTFTELATEVVASVRRQGREPGDHRA